MFIPHLNSSYPFNTSTHQIPQPPNSSLHLHLPIHIPGDAIHPRATDPSSPIYSPNIIIILTSILALLISLTAAVHLWRWYFHDIRAARREREHEELELYAMQRRGEGETGRVEVARPVMGVRRGSAGSRFREEFGDEDRGFVIGEVVAEPGRVYVSPGREGRRSM